MGTRHYVTIPDDLVSPRTRYVCDSVASYLSAVFELPAPSIIYLEPAAGGESRDDVDISDLELDARVGAAITRDAPNTIWLVNDSEANLVPAVAHEVGHIAELLGHVPERDNIEEFPQVLANAVAATYAGGVGWIDRLLNSNFYFQALVEGRGGQPHPDGWRREDYWRRLALTRPITSHLIGRLSMGERNMLASAWQSALEAPAPSHPDDQDRPQLFPVPRPQE